MTPVTCPEDNYPLLSHPWVNLLLLHSSLLSKRWGGLFGCILVAQMQYCAVIFRYLVHSCLLLQSIHCWILTPSTLVFDTPPNLISSANLMRSPSSPSSRTYSFPIFPSHFSLYFLLTSHVTFICNSIFSFPFSPIPHLLLGKTPSSIANWVMPSFPSFPRTVCVSLSLG